MKRSSRESLLSLLLTVTHQSADDYRKRAQRRLYDAATIISVCQLLCCHGVERSPLCPKAHFSHYVVSV